MEEKKKKNNWLLNILMLVCVIVFLGSGLYLVRYYKSAKNSEEAVGELVALKSEDEDVTESAEIPTIEGKEIQKKYRKLYKKNPDIIGWITVRGTKIDYPVMQTPKDNEYYLHRNYEKEYDVNGLPFLDAQCNVEDDESNLMVSGHHMKSGLMFKHLMDFAEQSFYNTHKTVYLDTLYEEREYEVVAAFYSQIYKGNTDAFKYYEYIGSLSEERFDTYVKNVKKLSVYDTGVTPKYGEQLLTMVTCAYHTEDGRFVVVARKKGGK